MTFDVALSQNVRRRARAVAAYPAFALPDIGVVFRDSPPGPAIRWRLRPASRFSLIDAANANNESSGDVPRRPSMCWPRRFRSRMLRDGRDRRRSGGARPDWCSSTRAGASKSNSASVRRRASAKRADKRPREVPARAGLDHEGSGGCVGYGAWAIAALMGLKCANPTAPSGLRPATLPAGSPAKSACRTFVPGRDAPCSRRAVTVGSSARRGHSRACARARANGSLVRRPWYGDDVPAGHGTARRVPRRDPPGSCAAAGPDRERCDADDEQCFEPGTPVRRFASSVKPGDRLRSRPRRPLARSSRARWRRASCWRRRRAAPC